MARRSTTLKRIGSTPPGVNDEVGGSFGMDRTIVGVAYADIFGGRFDFVPYGFWKDFLTDETRSGSGVDDSRESSS